MIDYAKNLAEFQEQIGDAYEDIELLLDKWRNGELTGEQNPPNAAKIYYVNLLSSLKDLFDTLGIAIEAEGTSDIPTADL